MDKFPIKKKWVITIAIVLIFALLNPTSTDFKDFSGSRNYYNFSKKYNFLVCSVYTQGRSYYLGILKNFINITYNPTSSVVYQPTYKEVSDSTRSLTKDELLKEWYQQHPDDTLNSNGFPVYKKPLFDSTKPYTIPSYDEVMGIKSKHHKHYHSVDDLPNLNK